MRAPVPAIAALPRRGRTTSTDLFSRDPTRFIADPLKALMNQD
jgi:hypothetical protein